MTFRARITLAAAAAVAVAVSLLAGATYVIVRDVLYDQLDTSLREKAGEAALISRNGAFAIRLPGGPFGASAIQAQIVPADEALTPPDEAVPILLGDRRVAAGDQPAGFRDATIDGIRVRAFVQRIAPGLAVLVSRSVEEVESTLSRLRMLLALVALVGIGGAALLGLVVARSALRPVRRLTAAAEDVARTTDLTRRIDVEGEDELSRLAASVNSMLASLEHAVAAQRNLVADASHELRTPLTSVRTNVELLARGGRMPTAERRRMLADVVAQLEELSALVNDLVELARDGAQPDELEDVRLDEVVAAAVERVRRRSPGASFSLDLSPSLVRGVPARLDRAAVNLLENAVAWNRDDAPIEVSVADGTLTVRDHGPGIADDDAERVFDRFYRAPAARGTPGSGLGLSIVRQVAEAHGGRALAERAAGGGSRFRLVLPVEPLEPLESLSAIS
jgi:two-component system sensor histidine kinase MprB